MRPSAHTNFNTTDPNPLQQHTPPVISKRHPSKPKSRDLPIFTSSLVAAPRAPPRPRRARPGPRRRGGRRCRGGRPGGRRRGAVPRAASLSRGGRPDRRRRGVVPHGARRLRS